MENPNIEEKEVVETEDTSPETQEVETEEVKETETPEESKEENIDYKKELERLEKTHKPKDEIEKAKNALYFNAKRFKELGGDPAEALGIKKPEPKAENTGDVADVVELKLTEREARSKAKSEDEYNLIMWYVQNRSLSFEEAYILANRGKILRTVEEVKRSKVQIPGAEGAGTKSHNVPIVRRSAEEEKVLQRRGLVFNPKTKTYQGKYTEEYYDHAQKMWLSRKLR